MSKATRMFEIIQILRSAATPMTAQAIGESLEVSKRTVYRDIAALQSMRVPIDGEAGIGFIMRPGFDLPPLTFSADEIEAIIVGLALLSRTSDTGLQRAAQRVADKFNDVLSDDIITQFKKETLHVSSWNSIPASDIEISHLRQAIRNEEKLRLTYTDAEGKHTQRNILPLAIIYYIEVIVLAAWCELRSDFRHFRIDRFIEVEPNKEYFSGQGEHLRKQWREKHNLP